MTYGSYSLDKKNAMVTRARIMVHGAGRNADHYFSTALTAAFLAGALENTVIVAPRFNRWPADLDDLSGYTAGMTADQLRTQLVERPTTYLLGQVDILPLGDFDSWSTAMAQGPTRRARGEAFFKYESETLGAKHKAIIVLECGHNDRCVFTTDVVLPHFGGATPAMCAERSIMPRHGSRRRKHA